MAENLPQEIRQAEDQASNRSLEITEVTEVAADHVDPGSERPVEISGDHGHQRQLGGVRTLPYIFANEIGDTLANVGLRVNMPMYFKTELNLSLVKSSTILAGFNGVSSFLPLFGSLVADSFAGRFWTIIVASLIYELGVICILLSAVLPSLRPSPCPLQKDCQQPSNLQLWVVYASFFLTAIAGGGLRPCLSTFAADQIDLRKASVEARGWNFFNWYSFGSSVALLAGLTILVYIQGKCGWGWGFGIPAIVWAVSIIAFVVGSPLYLKNRPTRSPLVRLAQVGVAAFKKRKLALPGDSSLLYRNRELDASISVGGSLPHSNQFKWLDKAALVTQQEQTNRRNPNLWRLNTVHRVEELKAIIRLLPIMASSILPAMVSSNLQTFQNSQAQTTNRHMTQSFEIPAASFPVFSVLTVMVGLVVYERALVPLTRRITKEPAGFTPLQRMGIGMFIHIIAMIVWAVAETRRKKVAAAHGLLDSPTATIPICFLWLVPQYIVHGIAEVFSSAGQMEFMYGQSPESMRSIVLGLSTIMGGIGNFLGIAFLRLVNKFTAPDVWLADRNINRGKLDSYFYLAAVINSVNLVYFLIAAWLYIPKPIEENGIDDADVELELDSDGGEEDANNG